MPGPVGSFRRMNRLNDVVRRMAVAMLSSTAAASSSLSAQPLPMARLQLAVPPSTWRLTGTGELVTSTDVASAQFRGNVARSASTTRLALRLGAPVWKRGLYRTVIANEVAFENVGLDFTGPATGPGFLTPQLSSADLRTLQHDLLVSQGLGPRWRISGVLQHGFFSSASVSPSASNYRAAGGAFLTRTYRPSLQVGAGVLALNVSPWVIPTIRVLHVGKRTRTDILLPRAEFWYDVGKVVEVGGTLRFLANRWELDQRGSNGSGFFQMATYRQTTLGPGVNLELGRHGLVQFETGLALRRILLEGGLPTSGLSTGPFRFANELDTEAAPFLRLSGRLAF